MTNHDEQSFLNAILATPDDDTPRLVFADWLDERNQDDDAARAAFIRLQCQAEREPRITRRRKLERDAKAILKKHRDHWAQALRDTKLVREWTFRRGFLDGIAMSATSFARNAEKVFAVAPSIRSAYFPDASNEMSRVASCKYLARFAAVDIREMCKCGRCAIHNDLNALFKSKHTDNLTTLNIAGDRMDAAGAKRLAESTALARLTSLDVSNNPLGNEGIAALGQSEHLKQLATLNLSATELGGKHALQSLSQLKNLPALQHLNLSNNRLSAVAIENLLASPLFAQLTSLDLSHNRFADRGAKLLAALPPTANLKLLDVRHVNLTLRGKTLLKKRFGRGVKT